MSGQRCSNIEFDRKNVSSLCQWFSTAGTRPGTGTLGPFHRDFEIIEIKDVSENAQKDKNLLAGRLTTKQIFTGTWTRNGWEPLLYVTTYLPSDYSIWDGIIKTTVKQRYNKLSSGSLLFGRYNRDIILTVNVSIVK